MERLKLFPKLMIVASLVLLPACADAAQEEAEGTTSPSAEEVQAEVEEAGEAVADYSEQQLKEFQAEAEAALAELEPQIDQLEGQAEQLGDEVEVELQDDIANLREEVAEAEVQLEQLGDATAENWEQLENELEVTMGELDIDLNQALTDLAAAAGQAGEELTQSVEEASQELDQETQVFDQRLENLGAYTVEQREAFEQDVTLLLQEYDTEIDALEEVQIPQADEATQAELKEQLAELRQQRAEIQQQLDQIEAASAEDWQELKVEIMAAIEALNQSFEETFRDG